MDLCRSRRSAPIGSLGTRRMEVIHTVAHTKAGLCRLRFSFFVSDLRSRAASHPFRDAGAPRGRGERGQVLAAVRGRRRPVLRRATWLRRKRAHCCVDARGVLPVPDEPGEVGRPAIGGEMEGRRAAGFETARAARGAALVAGRAERAVVVGDPGTVEDGGKCGA